MCPSNYVCYRKDRNRFGGGCAIFVKDKWPSKRRRDLESDSLEMVCVEICPNKAKNTIVGVFYKPPSMDGDKFVTHFKQDVLSKMFDGPNKDFILMSDFNADVIAPKRSKYTRFLLNEAHSHGLTQLIREPTRITENTQTAIDLVFVNNVHRFISHGDQDFPASDHSILFVVKKAGVCKGHGIIKEVRSFKQYNKEQFCKDVAKIPWSMVECFTNINDAVSAWFTLLIDVVNKHTPLKKFRSRNVSNPWITTDIKDLMAERNYGYKIAKRTNEKEQWNNYRKLKNMTNRKSKSAESLYYKNLIESAVNPKEM